MNNQIAAWKLNNALHHSITSASDCLQEQHEKSCSTVKNVREIDWAIGHNLFASIDHDMKLFFVMTTANDVLKPFNLVHFKPYLYPMEISNYFLCDLEKGLHKFSPPEGELTLAADIVEPYDLRTHVPRMVKST